MLRMNIIDIKGIKFSIDHVLTFYNSMLGKKYIVMCHYGCLQ